MAFQGKILFIVVLAFFMYEIRCDKEETDGLHMFLTRQINDGDEAPDLVESDDEGDTETTLVSGPALGNMPVQGTIYEELQSPEAMKLLTEEYVGLVETEIAAETVNQLMARIKAILSDRNAVQNFKKIRGEIYKYMTNPKMPKIVEEFLKNRYNYYVNRKTPELINEKFDKIRTVVTNKNIPKHIQFVRKLFVDFLTQPEDVRKTIAEGFTLMYTLLRIPHIPFTWN